MRDWKEIAITDIEGLAIGNAQNEEAGTGCTAIICDKAATAGVEVRGSAPASRETALLNPLNTVQQIHCVMLSGGSAFGLAAGQGAMRYLEEKGIGFDTGFGLVPIVCGSSLFDLPVGDGSVRPDEAMGYAACKAAGNEPVKLGNYGAGTGASVGKYAGLERMMKGGLGAHAVQIGEVKVGAIVAVNCMGDVFDIDTDEMIAGMRTEDGKALADSIDAMADAVGTYKGAFSGNTTIGCILTNADLTKVQANKLAQLGHNGYARAIRPVHTNSDGDTIYVMATGEKEVDPDSLGVIATEVMARAIASAVRNAKTAYGVIAACDL